MRKKKIRMFLLAAVMSLLLAACGTETEENAETLIEYETEHQTTEDVSITDETVEGTEPAEVTAEEDAETENADSTSHILIAYFTWAENTYVENPESIDVDATTSASVLPPGNAALLASWIQEETDGDLFSILVEEPYSSDYDECLDRAAEERAQNARPALVNHVENMEQYDIVFIGLPNWWYGSPMPVLSFLEEYDFSGKTIIPFVTHGTGGFANTLTDMQAVLPEDITMLDAIGVYRPEVQESQPAVLEWLSGLGIDFAENDSIGMETEMTEEMEENRIRIVLQDAEVVVRLEDNSASRDLLEQLPMTLEFEDYNQTEKIAYIEHELDCSDAPNSCDAVQGIMAYYMPWGNLSLFYEDFRESDQLVPLGMIEEGMEYVELIEDGQTVTIERIEE